MRVGIDIDDTITETSDLISCVLTKNNLLDKSNDFDSYSKIELDSFEDLIRSNIDEVLTNCPIKKNAKEVINYLKEKGNEIYLITSRSNHYSSNVYDITVSYLKRHGIEYDELLFGYEEKRDICLEKNIDIMLDDSKRIIESLKDTKVAGIMFDASYNKDYDGKRVSNWLEFKDYIDGLEG